MQCFLSNCVCQKGLFSFCLIELSHVQQRIKIFWFFSLQTAFFLIVYCEYFVRFLFFIYSTRCLLSYLSLAPSSNNTKKSHKIDNEP